MLFHPVKTNFQKNTNFDVTIGITAVIKKVDSYKCLDVNIDSVINWSKHVETIKSKLLKTSYFLNEKSLYFFFSS